MKGEDSDTKKTAAFLTPAPQFILNPHLDAWLSPRSRTWVRKKPFVLSLSSKRHENVKYTIVE